MKCFVSECNARYGGGLVLVAANSSTEALEIAMKDEDSSWYYNQSDMSDFEEVKGLQYDTQTPCVICGSVYME